MSGIKNEGQSCTRVNEEELTENVGFEVHCEAVMATAVARHPISFQIPSSEVDEPSKRCTPSIVSVVTVLEEKASTAQTSVEGPVKKQKFSSENVGQIPEGEATLDASVAQQTTLKGQTTLPKRFDQLSLEVSFEKSAVHNLLKEHASQAEGSDQAPIERLVPQAEGSNQAPIERLVSQAEGSDQAPIVRLVSQAEGSDQAPIERLVSQADSSPQALFQRLVSEADSSPQALFQRLVSEADNSPQALFGRLVSQAQSSAEALVEGKSSQAESLVDFLYYGSLEASNINVPHVSNFSTVPVENLPEISVENILKGTKGRRDQLLFPAKKRNPPYRSLTQRMILDDMKEIVDLTKELKKKKKRFRCRFEDDTTEESSSSSSSEESKPSNSESSSQELQFQLDL